MSKNITRLGEAELYEGSALDYAETILEDNGLLSGIPKILHTYFDAHAVTRDMIAYGDVCEIKFDGHHFVAGAW